MPEITEEDWSAIQSDIEACEVCRAESLFKRVKNSLGRPPNPGRPGRLLFISEAPPIAGGFWKEKIEDDLRKNLLTLLKRKGFEFPSDVYSLEALETFLSHGFFLVQTLKWPFARRGFNQCGSAQQRRLIEHSVDAHLRRELNLIAPRGILALGKAAWQACAKLSQSPLISPEENFEALVEKNEDYQLVIASGSIPLNVTYLPVDQNMRLKERAPVIKEGFKRFLERIKTTVT